MELGLSSRNDGADVRVAGEASHRRWWRYSNTYQQ